MNTKNQNSVPISMSIQLTKISNNDKEPHSTEIHKTKTLFIYRCISKKLKSITNYDDGLRSIGKLKNKLLFIYGCLRNHLKSTIMIRNRTVYEYKR